MRSNRLVTALTIAGMLTLSALPTLVYAQSKGSFIDTRKQQYTENDLEAALGLKPPSDSAMTRSLGQERAVQPYLPQQQTPPQAETPPPTVGLNVFFALNSDRILPAYYTDLDKLGRVLSKHQDRTFRIEGHTDDTGSEAYNQMLSEKRARSVMRYLVQNHNIPDKILIVKGYGESQPRFSNQTDEGRSRNRRVEISLEK